MLTLIKKWLGWEIDSDSFGIDRAAQRRRPSSATAHLFSKDSPALRRSEKTTVNAPSASSDSAAKKKATASTAKPAPRPNPDFDPYNTGKFDRSASWERISKTQR
jgi:hypothetical protein